MYSQRHWSSGYSDSIAVPCVVFTHPSSFTLIAHVLTRKGGCEKKLPVSALLNYLSVLQIEVAAADPMNTSWHNFWRGALNYSEVDGLKNFLWEKPKRISVLNIWVVKEKHFQGLFSPRVSMES